MESRKMSDSARSAGTIIKRSVVVVILAIAFGYIEAAVVAYLRAIFHPDGFDFPLAAGIFGDSSRGLLLTEVGREATTIVLIFTAAFLAGHNRRQRLAYFLIIFAVWDIFYYVWLRVLIGWPVSVLDWDILFLIPLAWAGPVIAPVVVSAVMLLFAGIILYLDSSGRPVKAGLWGWPGFCLAGAVVVVSFGIAGLHIFEPDFAEYFSWPLFTAGLLGAIVIFAKCVYRKEPPGRPGG